MLTARCIKSIDPWGDKHTDLTIGKEYKVTQVDMGGSYTSIYLKGMTGVYNSILFEFYKDGKKHNIYNDPKYNPYL